MQKKLCDLKKRLAVESATALLLISNLWLSPLALADGITAHKPLDFLKSIKGDPKPGAKIYDHICAVCHDVKPMINLGAPRIGVREDWIARQAKGMDVMHQNLLNGLGSMPARGGCFECSDEQLKAAIEYMLPVN